MPLRSRLSLASLGGYGWPHGVTAASGALTPFGTGGGRLAKGAEERPVQRKSIDPPLGVPLHPDGEATSRSAFFNILGCAAFGVVWTGACLPQLELALGIDHVAVDAHDGLVQPVDHRVIAAQAGT